MNDKDKALLLQEEDKRIEETVSKVKNRIAVFSGKGGVGKTTVSVNIAQALSLLKYSVGILDADITGPNVAKMLGVKDEHLIVNRFIIPYRKNDLRMISIAGFLGPGQPIIWRGPMRSKMINQFLADADWGELEYLISDLPPGTGDEILTIAQKMKPDYAVIVTTPQEVSIMDAERAINMAKKLEIPCIGVIENMSGFVCPRCSAVINIFGEGGGEKLAVENNVHFLGSIPIDIDARIFADKGKSIILEKPDCEVTNSFKSIAKLIEEQVKNKSQVGQ
jgi:Mrp family chromosome partitioning ATPase